RRVWERDVVGAAARLARSHALRGNALSDASRPVAPGRWNCNAWNRGPAFGSTSENGVSRPTISPRSCLRRLAYLSVYVSSVHKKRGNWALRSKCGESEDEAFRKRSRAQEEARS